MDAGTALATLLHVLVFVYWLGGDLGAFYAASLLTDARRPVAARAAAANVLANIDMAPRTSLILAAPTGLQLAVAKGWLALPPTTLIVLWIASGAWLAVAWIIHLRHAPTGAAIRQLDLVVRWLVIAGLLAAAAGAIPALGGAPFFIRLKLAILAAAILCGLVIRVALKPFGPAFAAMLKDGASAESNLALSRSITRARPGVLLIWTLLLAAAWLGVSTPTLAETS